MLEDGFDDELVGGAVVRDDVDVGVKAVDDLERVRERVLVELVGVRPDRLDQGAVDVEGDERLARRLRRVVDRVPSAPGRVSSCEAAAAVADVAVARWHLERAAPGGDEGGALQDVIDKSLAKDAICNIDDLLDHAE